ncbi:hypothetical protein [Carboxylicivirga marina]|uniref:SGNH/GDSL hydrolase family protein n=1 Tax=Carboxylicivirga marina TaxID=2800988 RepID=A0ABS1HP24_9BACT|nr:hypothetical protein [Carboxylicivirga marina]MBK3519438.1 hypothetical protein [Carboxylicivirga marina]
MRKFIIHISLLCITLSGTVLYIFSLADGYSDTIYTKISSPKQSNLILGTSKAVQGIDPEVLSKAFNKKFYNFSIDLRTSSFGEIYYNAVKQKLDTTSGTNNIFIITIDPWAISSRTTHPNDSLNFRETKSALNKGIDINSNPNFKYLLTCFENKYINLLFKDRTAFLHRNGWLEVNLKEDSISVERRTRHTLNGYTKSMNDYKYSSIRYSYLLKTINFLNKHGKVYLFRLPVHPKMLKIENTILPDFDTTIGSAISLSAGYWDMNTINHNLKFIDGVHLNIASCKEFSNSIAEHIKMNRKQ